MVELSIGEQLKHARLAQRLSVKDISQVTKIQPWVLEALEGDELHKTMSPVYVRGFVTTYAKCLHLDPQPLIQQLDPSAEPAEVLKEPPTPAINAWPSLEMPWYLMRRLGTAAAGLLLLIVMVRMKPLQRFSLSSPRQEANLAMSHDRQAIRPDTLTIPLNRPLEVRIVARRSTWISIEADGRLLAQRELAAGTQEIWKAKQQVKLIVAKPFYVDVLLNGQSISPLVLAHHGRLLIHRRSITSLPDAPGTGELKVQAGVSAE